MRHAIIAAVLITLNVCTHEENKTTDSSGDLEAPARVAAPFEFDFYIAFEKGADVRVAPSDTSKTIAHLSYGTQVRGLTESFPDKYSNLWRRISFGAILGYLRDRELATVHFPIESFRGGAFAGMPCDDLPEFFYYGDWTVLGTDSGMPDNTYSLGFLSSEMENSTVVLCRAIGQYGRRVDRRVVQVIYMQPLRLGERYVLSPSDSSSISCSDERGKLPIARVDFESGERTMATDGSLIYRGSVQKRWLFDKDSGLLKESSKEEESTCTIPVIAQSD